MLNVLMRRSCSTKLVDMVVTGAHTFSHIVIHGFTTSSSSHVDMVIGVMAEGQLQWIWIQCKRLVTVVVTHVVVLDVEVTRKSRVTIVASPVTQRNNVSNFNVSSSSSRARSTRSSRG